ncbi:hypothetical protein FA10DRAFT_27015 [Acaromyces ingoldii]|uniref:Uncharacterized protein n=1 Tax=Acaromyces ingoldii TaxID=215250 RepID=A0A316YWP1_9BASI|nr:hypothetical protein FA10DRAFT_27015 [Acaromyces ingoldii]PWN93601.1 hypothetical protein FA10DRAFT_27015 [Acaromyces ingoldii]
MLSPSLDSPQRPFAALAGPSSAHPPRVVQKCVARVKGTSRGAIYTLYLRLALPPSTTTQTFPLLPDDQVKLRSSAVYAVRPGSDPQGSKETSQGFKRAASILGLQTGIHADDFTVDAAASTAETKPRITTSNFHISLVQPPVSAASTVKQIRLVVLQLEVGLVAVPPTSPFIVSRGQEDTGPTFTDVDSVLS